MEYYVEPEKKIPVTDRVDVLVAGGGPAGIGAAVAAARQGCKKMCIRDSRKGIQTVTFLPYFLSWVILGGILLDIFSPRGGIVSSLFEAFHLEAPYFFGDPKLFPFMLVATDLWKEIGFNTIIFLAALTGLDVSLLEAAAIDGAGRWQQIRNIVIPSIASTVVLVTILGIGNIMNAGFDQVFMLYNPMVYSTGCLLYTSFTI